MTRTKRLIAVPVAVATEIYCPDEDNCGREEPIPASNGSFMRSDSELLPDTVTCPDCGKTFKVAKRIRV